MKYTELAELFLTRLYDHAQERDSSQFVSLDEIAAEFGVTDGYKVHQIAKYLENQGLINAALTMHDSSATITGEGAVFVELGGETGVIDKYRENPASFVVNINNSTNFHGAVSHSNVSAHSSHVLQQLASLPPGLEAKLAELVEALKQDTSLTKEALADALADVETLKLQLSKTEKNEGVIKGALSTLEKIGSVAKTAFELGKLIFGVG